MTTDELIKTLKIAAESEENIAKKMLFLMAAEKLEELA